MKRNLLFISLLAFSGTSLFGVDDSTAFRTALNDKGQSFLVGPVAQGPKVSVSNKKLGTQESVNVGLQEKPVASTEQNSGWFSRAKGWFTSAKEQISESYADAQAKVASIQGTDQEQFSESWNGAKKSWTVATEFANTAKEVVQEQFDDAHSYGQENKSTAAAVAAAGFTTGVALKYLWDKASTGARVAGAIGLSFAGVMLSDNDQAQTFAQENQAPLAIATAAACVGILSKTAYSWLSAKRVRSVEEASKEEVRSVERTPYSIYWTDKGSNFENKKNNSKKETTVTDAKPIIVELSNKK